jgi:hypothetical protein
MDKCRQQRINHSHGREDNPKRIHNQGSIEILENHGAAPPGGPDSVRKLPQIVSDQQHIRARMRDFRSTSHPHAYLSFGESRGIVDAVADHGNGAALMYQLVDAR